MTDAARSNLDRDRLIGQYRDMCRVRAFEEAALAAAREGIVPGPVHPSIGQEAVAVGVCGHLQRRDILLSTHRGHGHTLIKGASPEAMMRELLGRDRGCCQGKGGSMHIADFGVGMLGANILIAAGAAHAIKLRGEARIVVCIFGDGAVNRGPFLAGLNWAGVYRLPVLFVCEDNSFAATTRTRVVTAGDGPRARAEGLGIRSVEVDGNDVIAVDETTRALTEAVRSGGGPRFLHAKTYRLAGHTTADPATYRTPGEVEARWGQDPIARCATVLTDSGVDGSEIEALESEARHEMEEVLRSAREAPWPAAEQAFEDVQDLGTGS